MNYTRTVELKVVVRYSSGHGSPPSHELCAEKLEQMINYAYGNGHFSGDDPELAADAYSMEVKTLLVG